MLEFSEYLHLKIYSYFWQSICSV